MSIRELRIPPEVLMAALVGGRPEVVRLNLPADAELTDIALDHGHGATHSIVPPVIVLQISSNEFGPETAGRPILPMSFTR